MSPQLTKSFSSSNSNNNLEKNLRVRCEVRCRIPTQNKGEFYVHLYKNNLDNKEHLAIVAGPHIQSASLNAYREGDTDESRMIRGATPLNTDANTIGQKAINNTTACPYINNKIKDVHFNKNRNMSDVVVENRKNNNGEDSTTLINNKKNEEESSTTTTIINNDKNEEENTPKANHHNNIKSNIYMTSPPLSSHSKNNNIPLVRIHSECFTSETIYSCRCDCAEQLDRAMKQIQDYGNGVVIYLKQEGRNIGLLNKMMAYNLQDNGYDTVEANIKLNQPVDGRNYTIAARILEDLNINTIRLLTNNPDKIKQISSLNINVVERIPMIPSIFENLIMAHTSTPSSQSHPHHHHHHNHSPEEQSSQHHENRDGEFRSFHSSLSSQSSTLCGGLHSYPVTLSDSNSSCCSYNDTEEEGITASHEGEINDNLNNDHNEEDTTSSSYTEDEKYLCSARIKYHPGQLSELERYLQTKVECMSHDIPLPDYLLNHSLY